MLWIGFYAQPATRNSGCVFISDGFRKVSRRFAVDKASFSVGQYVVVQVIFYILLNNICYYSLGIIQ